MNYNELRKLDNEQKKTLNYMFESILNSVKYISLKKIVSLINDIPEICKMDYKSCKNSKLRKENKSNMHPIIPTRGEIYDANITEGVGKELCGRHPVVIIQGSAANMYSEKVTILPIEGDGKQIKSSYQERLTNDDLENNVKLIKNPSRVITSDLITIDKARLGNKIGKIKLEKMRIIDKKVKKQLNLD